MSLDTGEAASKLYTPNQEDLAAAPVKAFLEYAKAEKKEPDDSTIKEFASWYVRNNVSYYANYGYPLPFEKKTKAEELIPLPPDLVKEDAPEPSKLAKTLKKKRRRIRPGVYKPKKKMIFL
jgi:hypothetical protein